MKTEAQIKDQLIELELYGRFFIGFEQIRTLSHDEIDCMVIALQWVLTDELEKDLA